MEGRIEKNDILSNVHNVLALSLLQHKLLALANHQKLSHGACTHGVGHLGGPCGTSEAGLVVAIDAPREAVHNTDRTLGGSHIAISEVLQ